MEIRSIIACALLACFIINSCSKDGGGKGSSGNNNNNDTTRKDTVKTPPAPAVTVTQSALTILLPNNCTQQFTVKNTGPAGSTLDYTVKDDGTLAGFLNITGTSGSLAAGQSVTIGVNIKPGSVNSIPSLVGATLVADVYTPKASNLSKIPVPINIESITNIIPSFLGTWSGTWTGNSYGGVVDESPSAPVSGTWTLNLQSIDTVAMTATGTLTWDGTDVYWTYAIDTLTATPHPFIPDRTIKFGASNATFSYSSTPAACSQSQILLTIQGFKNQANPSDAFYGPYFSAIFDMSTKTILTQGNSFSAHPYDKSNFATVVSKGTLTGSKK